MFPLHGKFVPLATPEASGGTKASVIDGFDPSAGFERREAWAYAASLRNAGEAA